VSAEDSAGAGSRGRVILVGAGPGDPDLITVRGATALGRADVVLYDELASDELLSLARDGAECINVGKRGHDAPTRGQQAINELIVEHALRGQVVVRLKGGDPFVFGRGGEEASSCVAAGIPFEVVPGISSAVAAPAYAGIPVTDRRHSASYAVVTGHKDPTRVSEATRWAELGRAVDTLVILMGMRNLPTLVSRLIEGGKSPKTPAAAIMSGTLPEQRTVVSTLERLPEDVKAAELGSPAAVVIGDVVRLRANLAWREHAPLFGMRVLVTRASHQAGELASALRAAGAVPFVRPMIALGACEEPEAIAAIDAALARLSDYDDILFSSTNSVRFFAEHARRFGCEDQLPRIEARVFCIGERTAEAALAARLPVHFVAAGGGDAESMLEEMLRGRSPAGRRVLIPRSDIGRDVLPRGLREAGADVDAIAFYHNTRPDVDGAELREALVSGRLGALTFTSPSAVSHFADLLDDPAREAAGRCIIGAIGSTTAGALRKVGLEPDVVPQRPDVRDLVAALEGHAGSLRGGSGGRG
jgi:uroporphyrinogen III methyltransferase/synthase